MADGYALRFDGVSYPAEAERLFQSILAMPASTTRARSGIRAGGGLVVTVGGGPEAASVSPGGGIITDTSAGLGSWEFVIPSSVSKNLAARPASGQSRLDEVVARINTTTKEVEIAVITGTATSGTPTAPTIPSGNLRLAELLVPASPAAVTVQKPGQRIASLGGVLLVASQAERDAIEVIYDGLIVYREDTDGWQGRANGAWVDLATKQDTGWSTITLSAGFTGEAGNVPKKRTIRGNEVKLKGRINGTFAPNDDTFVTGTGAVPSPPERVELQISANAAALSCRAFVETDGRIHVITGVTAPVYVFINGLSGYMLD